MKAKDHVVRAARLTGGLVLILLLVAGAFQGGRHSIDLATAAHTDAEAASPKGAWTVHEESVGRTLTFSGRIEASTQPGPLVGVDGVVTSVVARSDVPVGSGSVLLTVGLRPVVAGQGEVPAFRDLSLGAVGADVAQLRSFLCAEGFGVCTASDRFTSATTTAVRAWQKSVGVEPDGVVRRPDIMWFPQFPVVLAPASNTVTGNVVQPGDQPFAVVGGESSIVVDVTEDQAALVPPGAPVHVGEVDGVVVGTERAPATQEGAEAGLRLRLASTDGVSGICAPVVNLCRDLQAGRQSTPVDVLIDVVPAQTGAGVPVRALLTGADGDVYVVRVDGTRAPVTVLGTSGGISLVDGVEVGDEIRIDSEPTDD